MNKLILVVEDQEDNRRILRDLLSNAGYDMMEAEDGEQALAAIARRRPDLILAEPVGSCTDLVATVVQPLRDLYGQRFERLRQSSFDFGNGRDQRGDDAPAIPPFETCGVVEHQAMRHHRRGHAAHFIEADVRLAARQRELEGPFGEFPGYYSGGHRYPVIEIDRLSHRKNPIFDAVYVGRPSRWGNPYRVGVHGTAAACVRLFVLRYAENAVYRAEVRLALAGKDLACWWPLDGQPCHADVLLRWAND